MSSDHTRQWRIVALAVVSSSGRPLFLKNFPVSQSAFSGGVTDLAASASSALSTPSMSTLEVLAGDAKNKYLAPWALKMNGSASNSPQQQQQSQQQNDDNDSVDLQQQQQQQQQQQGNKQMNLQEALSAALDCEDYTETETAQLFLYAALDRIDARRATEERRSGNPFESRGYAVFDRETRTKMKAFVLVRYWGRSLPSECHHPCQTVLNQLIQKATFAYCDPFRDVALDEPLSEQLVMDPFLTGILRSATEMPAHVR